MPLYFVRNDITKMNVDAIVNSTNRELQGRGTGIDGSIHAAAGPELQDALDEIGYCGIGEAVITDSYGISQCKYIIHTVGPKFYGWTRNEKELLENCYNNIFRLAEEKNCSSIAIPSISSGYHGIPKEAAYEIMTSCARKYLERHDNDIDIFLVLFSRDMVGISESEGNDVKQQITDHYRRLNRAAILNYYEFGKEDDPQPVSSDNATPNKQTDADRELPEYALQDLSFPEMCRWWVKEKGISMSHFYLDSDIAKSTFFNWSNGLAQPTKGLALSCCIGLQLDYEESVDLLERAGYAISKYYDIDQMIEYFIYRKEYNIYIIKEEIMEKCGRPLTAKKDPEA